MGKQIIDHSNKVQGKLTFIDYAYSYNNHAYWNIKCECGNKFIAEASRIIFIKQQKCMKCSHSIHDLSYHPLYPRVSNILRRASSIDEDLNSIEKLITYITENSNWEHYMNMDCIITRIDLSNKTISKDNLCWKEPRNSSRKLSVIYPIRSYS